MIELFIALLVIPTLTITVWEVLVHKMSINAKRVYRATGYLGVPVHELSHALVCILFGMRITKIALYTPNDATGRMGGVDFRYSPYSIAHGVGLALHGIAPLVAGSAIVLLLLNAFHTVEAPELGFASVLTWLIGLGLSLLQAAWGMAVSGPLGFCAVLLAMIVSMHAIPSLADITAGMRGLIILMLMAGAVAIACDLFWVYESELGKSFGDLLVRVINHIEYGLWMAVYGVVAVLIMAVLGGVVLILVPSAGWYGVEFVQGARGKI